ncbi:MAG: TetR family transcriptional regulator [Alkalinema sp. CACIAM 70d]|nr:MAG: TetR family transcriptional regulator [Alkalinema sp. CACIAM 70d]
MNTAGLRRKPRQARSQERVDRILAVAEALFTTEGYGKTTTNAIAAQAQVPIGSFYQFFPDKAAILQALTIRYTNQLQQYLKRLLDTADVAALPLPEYVEQLIDATDQFFTENPGYYAIFMEAQSTIPDFNEIDRAADMALIEDLSTAFAQRNPTLTQEDCEVVGFVVIKVIGNLLWLSIDQDPIRRQRLVLETKKLALSYLQNYFPSNTSNLDESLGSTT